MSAPVDRAKGPYKTGDLTGRAPALATPAEQRNLTPAELSELVELNTRGDQCLRSGKTSEAIRCFERAGKAYKEANFIGKALAVYKKLERIDPTNAECKFALAELSVGLKRRREACKYFETAIDLDPLALTSQRSVSILKGICELSPEDTALWLELARTCVNGSFMFEATEAFLAAAREFAARDDAASAIAAYQSALEQSPTSPAALTGLSELLINDNRVADAIALVKGVVERNPHDTDLLTLLGKTYRTAERFDEAVDTFTRLMQIDPRHVRFLLEIASRLASAGDVDRALSVVDKALRRAPGLRAAEPVVGLLKQIAATDPSRDEALERIADIHAEHGDTAAAIGVLERLVERATSAGKTERVVKLLGRIVRLDPERDAARTQLLGLTTDEVGLAIVPDTEPAVKIEEQAKVSRSTEPAPRPPVRQTAPIESRPPAPVRPDAAPSAHAPRPAPPRRPSSTPSPEADGGAFARWLQVVRHRDEAVSVKKVEAAPAEPVPGPTTGSLAGIVVVRNFEGYLDAEWRRAARSSTPVSLLRIRVFQVSANVVGREKSWNDLIAETLEHALERPGDLLVHCGAGDYVAVLPATPLEGAVVVAKKMGNRVLDLGAGASSRIGVGIVAAMPKRTDHTTGFVDAAERALFTACASSDRLAIVTDTI